MTIGEVMSMGDRREQVGKASKKRPHLHLYHYYLGVQFSLSVMSDSLQSHGLTIAHQASLSISNSWSLLKLMPIVSVMQSNHPILCCPLLLPPSIIPSIRVFFQ